MNKNLLNSIIQLFIRITSPTFIITIINYSNLLKPGIISVLKLIIPILSIFIASFKLGKQSEKKGYIEGIKIGSIIIIIFSILVLLLDKFKLKTLLYYLILLLTSILSSMIGINQKKQ